MSCRSKFLACWNYFSWRNPTLRCCRQSFYRPKQFSDYIYSIFYWSNPEYAIGLGRFLLKLKLSDEFFVCCVCGPLFGSRLHPNGVDIFGKIFICVSMGRENAARLLLLRMHLLPQFPDERLKKAMTMDEKSFSLLWRGVMRKEKYYFQKR